MLLSSYISSISSTMAILFTVPLGKRHGWLGRGWLSTEWVILSTTVLSRSRLLVSIYTGQVSWDPLSIWRSIHILPKISSGSPIFKSCSFQIQSISYNPWIMNIPDSRAIFLSKQNVMTLCTAQSSAHCEDFSSLVFLLGLSQKVDIMPQLSTSGWCLDNVQNHQ